MEGMPPSDAAVGTNLIGRSWVPDVDALNLLVVEPARDLRTAYGEVAQGLGFAFHVAETGEAARRLASAYPVDVILLEWRVSGGGLGLLKGLKEMRPEAEIILATAGSSVRHTVEAMRHGAADVMAKPFAMEELRGRLEGARVRRQSSAEERRIRERLRGRTGSGG